jgi:hypothetical protein
MKSTIIHEDENGIVVEHQGGWIDFHPGTSKEDSNYLIPCGSEDVFKAHPVIGQIDEPPRD